MKPYRNLSIPEQVAAYLSREMEEGRLEGTMPGVLRLEPELGVNRKTVEAALRILEKKGILIPQGAGKCRRIAIQTGKAAASPLRVAVLLHSKNDIGAGYVVDLRHSLHEAGHLVSLPRKTLTDLRMRPDRVARLVRETAADAWVVQSGSREVLDWFAAQDTPVMALFGRRRQLPIASVGPDKVAAIRAATRALLELGHRRIVLLARRENREPNPSVPFQAFLDELAASGIKPGPYHLPAWVETAEGLHECLESLFRVTSPTAMIVDGVAFWVAIQQFLASRKVRIPQDFSLVCTDGSPEFAWCRPAITHIHWDSAPVVSRVVRWANRIGRGETDLRKTSTLAEFVRGGTIGPVKER